jgi:apolipoprotein D and lipocalin family protein
VATPRRRAFAIVAACVSFAGGAAAQTGTLAVVPTFDLDRYLGRWHEIARYPNRFERMCVDDVIATYRRNDDGTLAVVNECRAADGTRARAEGLARVVAPARLEVRFAPAWLGWLPWVWGDYWVIDLAPDYRWAVVGEPAREYLWILAREPVLDETTWQAIVRKLPAAGYDPARLVVNPPAAR